MSLVFFFSFRRLFGARVAPLSPLFLLHLRRCHLRCYFWFFPPFSFKGSANARADFFWRVRVWALAFFPSSPFVQFCRVLLFLRSFSSTFAGVHPPRSFSFAVFCSFSALSPAPSPASIHPVRSVFNHPRSFSFFALFFPGVLFLVFPFLLSPLGSRKR